MTAIQPLVSVVIPTYNRARLVGHAIDSVLAQTYRHFEIIVINNSSTDDTADLLRSYGDKIRPLYQERAGVSAARNYGIQEARGDWVAFLDSDDEWLPGRLAAAVKAVTDRADLIAHFANVTIEMPGGDPVSVLELRGVPWRHEEYHVLERPLLDVLKYQFCFSSSYFVKKESLVQAGMFDRDLSFYEDLDLSLRLALVGPWGVGTDPMVRLIRRDEAPQLNLSQQRQDRPIYGRRCLVRTYGKLVNDKSLDRMERAHVRKQLSATRFDLGLAQIKEGLTKDGCANIRRSFFDRPSPKSLAKYLLIRFLKGRAVALVEKKRNLRETGLVRSA